MLNKWIYILPTFQTNYSNHSKHSNQKQIILLITQNGKGWNYLAVKKLSVLLRGITSKHDGDTYCFHCRNSFRIKNKLVPHKIVYENKDFSGIVMLFKDTKLLEFNEHQKSEKTPSIIYPDFKSEIIKKADECKNNPKNLSTTKVDKYLPCSDSMSMICIFDGIENKHNVYRGTEVKSTWKGLVNT